MTILNIQSKTRHKTMSETPERSQSQLFVTEEDEDVVMTNETAEDAAENDPVVSEIPINLTNGPFPLHILQYLNKPRKIAQDAVLHPPVSQVRYKTKSALWELDVPVNTEVFYDKNRAEDNWDSVAHQTLKGVSVPSEGQYVGLMVQNELYLAPVEAVAQVRPFFKYIDSAAARAKRDDDDLGSQQAANPQAKKAQMVTMSVKSSSEANQPRLGGALLAHKVADEEPPQELEWIEGTFPQFQQSVITEEARVRLQPLGKSDDYLSKAM
ncbi:LAME_0A05754g1_1 [Lachancea meyersii CBS 8951]|uniref:LAME_0A05754g1_1 n=1 Tax=Lachancea meyersii CBS 8951 TaxID=1266667 RepID=A0A1G4IPY3_9SACH|nr:LAME_0A05754g1_1 [Lachancea meyersii CBS 8951]